MADCIDVHTFMFELLVKLYKMYVLIIMQWLLYNIGRITKVCYRTIPFITTPPHVYRPDLYGAILSVTPDVCSCHFYIYMYLLKQVAAQWLKCTIRHSVDNCIV